MHSTVRKTQKEPIEICPDCRLGHLRTVREAYEHHFVYEGPERLRRAEPIIDHQVRPLWRDQP